MLARLTLITVYKEYISKDKNLCSNFMILVYLPIINNV